MVAAPILALLFGLFIYLPGLEDADKIVLNKIFGRQKGIRSKKSKEGR